MGLEGGQVLEGGRDLGVRTECILDVWERRTICDIQVTQVSSGCCNYSSARSLSRMCVAAEPLSPDQSYPRSFVMLGVVFRFRAGLSSYRPPTSRVLS